MSELPLHPALVHIPLGLAVVAPIVALYVAMMRKRDGAARRAWIVVVALQALLLGSALSAQQAGETDRERVESIVPETAIETHEERAELFVLAAAVSLGVGLIALAAFPNGLGRAAAWTTVIVMVGVLGLAVRTGEAGGKLVYQHGAANAHIESQAPLDRGPPSARNEGAGRQD